MFDKILIANRGEIACGPARLPRAGHQDGGGAFRADPTLGTSKLADESVCIGRPAVGAELPSTCPRISAAEVTDARPSTRLRFPVRERRFRRAVEKSGFVFIGPRPKPSA